MANTWTARTAGTVAFASNKSMIAVVNLASSGVVVRVYRIWALNNQTAVVTGVSTPIQVQRVTTAQTTEAGITGTVITPVAHDTNNTALTNKVACYTNATTNMSTTTSIYRQVILTADEPATTVFTPDEWWEFPMICEIFNAGYKDSNLEPIVLRPGEGLEVRQPGSNATGVFQFNMLFTSGAS